MLKNQLKDNNFSKQDFFDQQSQQSDSHSVGISGTHGSNLLFMKHKDSKEDMLITSNYSYNHNNMYKVNQSPYNMSKENIIPPN